MTLEERRKGAERLMKDPVFQAAMKHLRQEALETLAASEFKDREGRETMYFAARALTELPSLIALWAKGEPNTDTGYGRTGPLV